LSLAVIQPVGCSGNRQVLKRIDSLVQVTPRQMQVNAGRLQVSMPKPDLYGGQIGTVLEKVSGKAVPAMPRAA